jgi:Fe-S oxidoreductase
LVTSVPRTHVVIIGIEKIVASWTDAAGLATAHAVSATGQRTTVYISCISQRQPLAGSLDGREFHVIILDNGRSAMRDDPEFRDALNCIRCGACMNICPTYGVVGGHAFGYIYPGPIGIPWTAKVHGLDEAAFSQLCVSCGLCKEICPVDIDISMMIARVKEQRVKQNGQLFVNGFLGSSESLARLSSATAPFSNWMLSRGLVRYLMEKTVGIDRRRTLPKFSRKRLRSRLARVPIGDGSAGKIVFFPDLYADYNEPELGVKAVTLLQRLGYTVEIPELKWSGMPYISYGELGKAKEVARFNLDVLTRYADAGYEIVSTEPTAVYLLKDVYTNLIPTEGAKAVAERSHGFFEYIRPRLGELEMRPTIKTDSPVGFHIPCHERALTAGVPAVDFLKAASYDIRIIETGTCCGMAGTFGMKRGPIGYDLSMAVGEGLFKLVRESGCNVMATESSVCSIQIEDGTAVNVLHPLDMVEIV